MLEHRIDVKDQLKCVLDEQGWDDLAASEWRTLSNITCLLWPFAKFTSLLSGDEYTTLSYVFHLEEVCYSVWLCMCCVCVCVCVCVCSTAH